MFNIIGMPQGSVLGLYPFILSLLMYLRTLTMNLLADNAVLTCYDLNLETAIDKMNFR